MIVYRLEDPKMHRGPFNYPLPWPKKGRGDSDAIHSRMGCTVPIGVMDISEYRFATESVAALERYWGKRFKYFLEAGYVIGVYRVRKNHVMFGHKGLELAFRADKAVRF